MKATIILILPLVLLISLNSANAAGILHFKPDKGATVAANQFLAVNGTSMASNDTNTHCTVSLQTNGHGYNPVTPVSPGNFTKWSATTSEKMKVGTNDLEAQILCFPPTTAGSNDTGSPNLTHHLNHNVTGV